MRADLERMGRSCNLLSVARLVVFFAALALFFIGAQAGVLPFQRAALALGLGFVALIVWHARLSLRREQEELRLKANEKHVSRADGQWTHWLSAEVGDPEHAYAHDLDLVGPGSLVRRIDVAHTERGRALIRRWLSEPAESIAVIELRQRAVAELSSLSDLRVELEVAAQLGAREGPLAAEGFVAFTRQPSPLGSVHRRAAWILPPLTAGLMWAGSAELVSSRLWLIPALVQGILMLTSWSAAWRRFDLLDARKPQLEAFARMLALIEGASFEAPLLRAMKRRLESGGRPPSQHLKSLAFWAGLADTRRQILIHAPLNLLLMWDVHVLAGLERWNQRAGRDVDDWLWVVAELEALSCLAALHTAEPNCTFPKVLPTGSGFVATAVAHPLLRPGSRVANDVTLACPGSVLVVTGSNMAGKSTLLRAVGLNVALALAGGPVCAARFELPRVRLRASMRAVDELHRGASYFLAELAKLKRVIAELDRGPPVFFLLDELLRGTHARARAIGAAAVLRHLLHAGSMGLTATHDPALCELAEEADLSVENAHLTDVVVGGEMIFDYRLRAGRATSSNALRLLRMAGVDTAESFGEAASPTI